MTIGRVRPAVAAMPSYRPGKDAKQAEAEHGITDAIKLASNENPMPPIDAVVAAVSAAAAGVNRYADHRATALRAALAAHLGVADDMVTVAPGSSGILQQLFLTFVDPGDEVVYPWRSFEVYPVYTQLVAGVAVTVPLGAGHVVDLDAIAAAITPATKLVFIANANNPTGTAVSTEALAGFCEQVPDDVIVCIDEAYREFASAELGDPITDLLPGFPNVIVTRTFSKAAGLAGLRVGMAIAHPELIASVDKTQAPFAVNALAQAGALAAIQHHDEVDRRVAELVAERSRVVEALAGQGWPTPPSEANFVWLDTGANTDVWFVELEKRGVVTRPFSGEGIRVTISTPAENDRFLAAWADVTS